MLHSFQLNGYNIIMDVNSGAVHVVDEMVYDMVQLLDASFLANSFDSNTSEKLEKEYPGIGFWHRWRQDMTVQLWKKLTAKSMKCMKMSAVHQR